MTNIVIGIDPDSDRYGLAWYVDGKLTQLRNYSIVELANYIEGYSMSNQPPPTFVIEDVAANKFMYNRGIQKASVINNIAQKVGRCKQAQRVAEQFIEYRRFKLIRQPPTKGNWAKNKKQFERVTGWTGRSNQDTRSAAFLAYLHL